MKKNLKVLTQELLKSASLTQNINIGLTSIKIKTEKKIQQSLNVQYSPPKVSIHLQIQNVTSFGNGVSANVCAGVKGVTVEVI